MKILRYRIMYYPPSWGDNRDLAEFDFYLSPIQDVVQRHLKHIADFPAVLKYPARVKERDKLLELSQKLTQFHESDQPFEAWPHGDDDGIWWFMDGLALEGEWEFVRCLECDARYRFDDCRIENWSHGGGLAAEGGRDMFCPRAHSLCHSREWNS